MKRITFILLLLSLFFFYGCGSSTDTCQDENAPVKTKLDSDLAELLSDNPELMQKAADNIIKENKAVLIPKLVRLLGSDNADRRYLILGVLGDIGNVSLVTPILPFLNDEKWHVRVAALTALGKIGDKTVIPEIIPALQDQDQCVKVAAIYALGSLGNAEAIPHLVPLLKDNNSLLVRTATIAALGMIGKKSAIPFLLKYLNDKDYNISFVVIDSLSKIGDKSVVPELVKILQTKDLHKDIYWKTIEALGVLGDDKLEPILAPFLEHEDEDIRWMTAGVLGKIGCSTSVVPALLKMLAGDKNAKARYTAADTLGIIKDKSAVQGLISGLKDGERAVRLSCVIALKEIAHKSSIPSLIDCLDDPESYVRSESLRALRKITNQDFDNDAAKWREWWEENKEHILKENE